MVSVASPAQLTFPAVSFRRIPSPADPQQQRSYVAVVSVFDLPDLASWRRINVRDAKETGAVPKAIRETLDESPDMFFFKNRGLVITANSVAFDTESALVTLALADPNLHGLLDGGHTYTVIQSYISQTERGALGAGDQAFVRVEILEGFGPDQIVDIVEARNTSNQVKDQSLLELQQAFEGIKKQIAKEAYANKVAYKEYEIYEGTDGKRPKPIDVREIVSLLTVFDKDHWGDNNHPIMAYSRKAACLNRFKDYAESYEKLYPLIPQILALWDMIHGQMPSWWQAAKESQGQGAKFGRITGVIPNKTTQLHFLGEESIYAIPTAFKYPILAALRAFLEEKDGKFVWGKGLDPADALEDGLGQQLTEAVINNALEIRNPTKLGKTNSVWDQCYSKAQIWYLKA